MAKLTMRMVRRSLREVGVSIRNDTEWGEYVVRIRGSAPGEGYHTSDLADAYQTGHAMALADERTRDAAIRHADIKPAIDANERAKREDEAMLGLPRGSMKG
jgi:type IV secretory pathway TrbL component